MERPPGPLYAGEALLEARTQASVAFKIGAHSAALEDRRRTVRLGLDTNAVWVDARQKTTSSFYLTEDDDTRERHTDTQTHNTFKGT